MDDSRTFSGRRTVQIEVVGSAELQVVADYGILSFEVCSTRRDSEGAIAEVRSVAAPIMARLEELKSGHIFKQLRAGSAVTEMDISPPMLTMQYKVMEYNGNAEVKITQHYLQDPKLSGAVDNGSEKDYVKQDTNLGMHRNTYFISASIAFAVLFHDTDIMTQFAMSLTQTLHVTIRSVQWAVGRAQAAATRRDTVVAACQDANEKAGLLALSLGKSGLQLISCKLQTQEAGHRLPAGLMCDRIDLGSITVEDDHALQTILTRPHIRFRTTCAQTYNAIHKPSTVDVNEGLVQRIVDVMVV